MTRTIVGDDGARERLCKHGVGHPVKIHRARLWTGIHTCCHKHCCSKKTFKATILRPPRDTMAKKKATPKGGVNVSGPDVERFYVIQAADALHSTIMEMLRITVDKEKDAAKREKARVAFRNSLLALQLAWVGKNPENIFGEGLKSILEPFPNSR